MGKRTGRPRGWIDDPVKRHERSVKAGQAAKLAHQRRALERAKGMAPERAYEAGYNTGYARAYHYWRAWWQRCGLKQHVRQS